jgi:non-specific serine/threonine protein kinase
LRAIVNRATDRRERRYLNARTLQRARAGSDHDQQDGGRSRCCWIGCGSTLPLNPAAPTAQPCADDSTHQRPGEIVLDDIALSFELLRTVNNATLAGGRVSSDGPVLICAGRSRCWGWMGCAAPRTAPLAGPMNERRPAR